MPRRSSYFVARSPRPPWRCLRRRAGAWLALGLCVAGASVAASAPLAPARPARLVAAGGAAAGVLGAWAADGDGQRAARALAAVRRRQARPDATSNRLAHGLLEFAYLLVYPMVPAGLLAVSLSRPASAGDFWLALLAAVLPCYGLLPLLPTRPPRAFLLPDTPTVGTTSTLVRRANVQFLATFGNRWNTLPSGHAAGAAAVAMMVWRSGSPLAPVFAMLALGIALGTVRGRYHYAVDTVLGVALGIAAAVLLA